MPYDTFYSIQFYYISFFKKEIVNHEPLIDFTIY